MYGGWVWAFRALRVRVPCALCPPTTRLLTSVELWWRYHPQSTTLLGLHHGTLSSPPVCETECAIDPVPHTCQSPGRAYPRVNQTCAGSGSDRGPHATPLYFFSP